MLIQLVVNHPQAVGTILKSTPTWVWGLLAGLMALGFSQVRDRSASLARVTLMPVAMTAFSLWGTASAFGSSPQFATVLLVWLVCASLLATLIGRTSAPATYDRASRTYAMQGSWMPLLTIAGIFMTKYLVGVELAMQPQLAHDGQFTLVAGALYGVFNGIFAGRAVRLWRLAFRGGVDAPMQAA